jgi:hypothetical protein
LGNTDLEAGDRFQVGGDGQGGIHGHGGLWERLSNPILYCARRKRARGAAAEVKTSETRSLAIVNC